MFIKERYLGFDMRTIYRECKKKYIECNNKCLLIDTIPSVSVHLLLCIYSLYSPRKGNRTTED